MALDFFRHLKMSENHFNHRGHFVFLRLKIVFFRIDGLRKNGYTAALDGKGVLKKLNLTYKGNSW